MNGNGQKTKSNGENLWLLMLSLGGEREPLYVSAKRTHRFLIEKNRLSNCGANRSGKINPGFSVGSFWKTNPPEGVF